VAVPVPDDGGLVQGFDRAEGLAFALVEEGARVVGDVVLIEREGRKVGAGRVDEVIGRMVSIKLSEGEARLGDRLR
jgi:predicted kinase